MASRVRAYAARAQRGLFALFVVAAVGPAAAAAQAGAGPSTGWPAVEIGLRAGYDNLQRQEVLGALLRIPVIPSGVVELMPSADVSFLRGVKDYQVNFEAIYLFLAGDDGGLYAGGGVGLRRSTVRQPDLTFQRETLRTFSIVVGLKLMPTERVNPLVEFRRVFTEELAVDPQLISIGATFELW